MTLMQLLYTIGGIDNYRMARKYYSAAIELSGGQNLRALYGVCLVCTQQKSYWMCLCLLWVLSWHWGHKNVDVRNAFVAVWSCHQSVEGAWTNWGEGGPGADLISCICYFEEVQGEGSKQSWACIISSEQAKAISSCLGPFFTSLSFLYPDHIF